MCKTCLLLSENMSNNMNNLNSNMKHVWHVKIWCNLIKKVFLFTFKVWGPKYIKVSNNGEFLFCVKVHVLKT